MSTVALRRRPPRPVVVLSAAVLLAGCASVNPEAAFAPVQAGARERLGIELPPRSSDEASRAARAAQLLRQPLSADNAVQLALWRNRALQAALLELDIADADLAQAGRLSNPGFSFSRLRHGDEVEYERGLHLGLSKLLLMPLIRQMEARRVEAAQGAATLAVLTLAADVRKAWVQAVHAEQVLQYREQVARSAAASAELARRMAAVGNFNKLQQAREQAFSADAALNLALAQQARLSARERLLRLLGLWGDEAAALSLPDRLPELPAQARELPQLEGQAIAQRLDVQGARLAVDSAARSAGLTDASRFVGAVELGLMRNGDNEGGRQRGYEISLELPLFDWGDVRQARARAMLQQATLRAAQTAIEARSEVREAYGQYRSAWDVARHHREHIVPLRARIAEENLLRYNGMLIGVFELLADARQQVQAVIAAIDAQRDFWLAEADLGMSLVGRPSLFAPAAARTEAAGGGPGH